ncbi:cyclase family protein [Achromobacter piechaudii]|uniref:cyclase family protein n=1 Tax=Achromobacter piechaudii TaxID=72556 RepID=UPI003DA9E108
MPQRWKHAPPGSNWGEFGPDDRRGRMNLVDRTKVLQGIAEVRQGLTFCLSLPLDVPGGMALNPRRLPPQRYATLRDGKSAGAQGFCWSYASEDPLLTDVVCDDVLLMNTQYSTQWDSLAHMGSRFDADGDGAAEAVFYNGFRAGVDVLAANEDPHALADWARFPGPSAGALGIEHLAEHGVQGRAVMIDLEAHVGRTRSAVGYDQLMRILEADDVAVEAGDMVCLHTGFGDTLMAMNRQPDVAHLHATGSGLDGDDPRLLQWIVDSRLACLIADNPAVELVRPVGLAGAATPLRRPRLPLHEHCLFKNGIHLGELWWLTPLARWLRANERHRFLLTAPPLRLPGAAGSPTTPIATV